MAVTFNKQKGMKYTDMCIYIEKNMPLVINKGEYPEVEGKIFQYMYHIIYALSCKKCYFKRFEDYDNFALYVAADLYVNMRNRYINAGKIVRGKEIKPVKSVLNYIKAILFPMRVNYQNQYFASEMDPSVGQDTSKLTYNYKESIRVKYNSDLEGTFEDCLKKLPNLIKNIIYNTPYRNNKLLTRRLYFSCYLSFLDQITFTNVLKNKLEKKLDKNKDADRGSDSIKDYFYTNYLNSDSIILWHLDESFRDYVSILMHRIKESFSKEFSTEYHRDDLNENLLDCILKSAIEVKNMVDEE